MSEIKPCEEFLDEIDSIVFRCVVRNDYKTMKLGRLIAETILAAGYIRTPSVNSDKEYTEHAEICSAAGPTEKCHICGRKVVNADKGISLEEIKNIILKVREDYDAYKELSHFVMDKIAESIHAALPSVKALELLDEDTLAGWLHANNWQKFSHADYLAHAIFERFGVQNKLVNIKWPKKRKFPPYMIDHSAGWNEAIEACKKAVREAGL